MSHSVQRRARPAPWRSRLLVRSLALAVSLTVALVLGLGVTACGGDSEASSTTPSSEHKITVAGDSISVGLGSQLRDVVAGGGDKGVVVKVIGEPGTGLARPDSFDWPKRIEQLARDHPPQVLVFSVGSNDAQDLTDSNGKVVATMAQHDHWDAEYRRRLAEVFDAFAPTGGDGGSGGRGSGSGGTKVVWVGHVRTAEDRVADTNRRVHALAAEVAADRPWVVVKDLAELLGTGEQTATRCLASDGLHLIPACLREADEQLLGDLGRA